MKLALIRLNKSRLGSGMLLIEVRLARCYGSDGHSIVHLNAHVKELCVHPDADRGLRLREQRELQRWSQQQAADAAGVRREMWARYEVGAEPGAAALARLAAAGLDIVYILTGGTSIGTAQQAKLTPRERALLDNYRNSSSEAQRALSKRALRSRNQ